MKSTSRRIILVLSILLLAVPTMFYGLRLASRAGETKVIVNVAPVDSEVFINGRKTQSMELYLTPGDYIFEAKRSGFADDKQSVSVNGSEMFVDLLPEPNSDEALELLRNDPKIQEQREAIGGRQANTKGQILEEKSPIINLLPYTDIEGPFTIDFGPSEQSPGGVFLEISDSSPEGRRNALKWIRLEGYDPAEFDIDFDGFINPLLGAVE